MNRVWRWVAILSLTITSSIATWAAIHPVPLKPDTDPSVCLECHTDKNKGKHVHSAMAMGCTACHQIRVYRNITRVLLVTPSPSHLCLTCHADKDASKIKGRVHPPAVRDCLKCHSPHSSDFQYQLLKAPSGDSAKDNLCLECHKIGVNIPKGGSRHPALDMGCNTCHITHKTGPRGVREFDYHLTKDAPALCLDCHDVKDPALIKAHHGQPFGKADCLECHDPHQSDKPFLLAKYTHPPFASGQCDVCHKPAKDGKVVLTAATPKEICVMCHSDIADQIDKSKVPHPGAQMSDCTDCHSPHGGRFPCFPKPNPVAVCTGCHSDIGALGKKAHPHKAAFDVQGGCAVCHDPHGSSNNHILRASTPNKLCLECHGPDSHPTKVASEHVVTIFKGKVRLPEDYFRRERVVILPLKYGRGHPIAGHPVTDVTDPMDVKKIIKKINCLTCHQPHSSSQPNLLVKDQTYNSLFCASCHTNLQRR